MLDLERKKGEIVQYKLKEKFEPLEELQEDVFDPNGFLVDEVPATAIAVHFLIFKFLKEGSKNKWVSEKDKIDLETIRGLAGKRYSRRSRVPAK